MHVPGRYLGGPCTRADPPPPSTPVYSWQGHKDPALRVDHGQPWHGMAPHEQLPGPLHLRSPAPPPPREMPPPTYTWAERAAIPRDTRAAVAAAARASCGLAPTRATTRHARMQVALAKHRHTWLPTGAPAGGTRGPHVSIGSWGRSPESLRGGGGGQLAPSARPKIVVRPAPQHSEGCPPPLQPTFNLLLKLLEGGPRPTAVMSLVRPYKHSEYPVLAASGVRRIPPRHDAHDWPVTDDDTKAFKDLPPLDAGGTLPHPREHGVGAAAGGGESPAPFPTLWKKPATSDQLSPYFGGLVSGDEAGRVGVRIQGKALSPAGSCI